MSKGGGGVKMHRPNCTKRPQHDRKLQPRSVTTAQREGFSYGAWQAAEPSLPQKPKWRHASALYTETRAGTILSSSITGSNANPDASISCHCLSLEMKTAI